MVFHDDRKPFKRWFSAQRKYAKEEAVKLNALGWNELDWKDKIRKCIVLAPVGIIFFGLFGKGLILDGWPGVVYCGQRFIAEGLLSLELVKRVLFCKE